MRGAKSESSEDLKVRLTGVLDALGPLGQLAGALGLSEGPGTLHMEAEPHTWLIR
jgi:hypothetical protein